MRNEYTISRLKKNCMLAFHQTNKTFVWDNRRNSTKSWNKIQPAADRNEDIKKSNRNVPENGDLWQPVLKLLKEQGIH